MIGLFNECFPPVMDGVSLTVSNLARCLYQQGKDRKCLVSTRLSCLIRSYSTIQFLCRDAGLTDINI